MIARSHWYWCSNHLGTLVCSILIPTWTDLSSIHRWAALREETSQQLVQPVVQLSTPRSGPTADGNLQRLMVPIFSAGNALIVLVPLLDSLDFASPIFWYLLMPACPVTKSAQCPLLRKLCKHWCDSHQDTLGPHKRCSMFVGSKFERRGPSERVHYLPHIIKSLHNRSNNQVLSVTLPSTWQ